MMTQDDSPTTRALRGLDAADQELVLAHRTRAAATLERILATDPDSPTPTAAPTGRPRHRAYRLLLVGSVVVAAAAAVVAIPVISEESEAFASWTPTPVELTGDKRTAAVDACLVLQGNEMGELAFDPRADASVLVAEARGGWSYVVFEVAGASGRELQGSCLIPEDQVVDPRPGRAASSGASTAQTRPPGQRRRVTWCGQTATGPGPWTTRLSCTPRVGPAPTSSASR